MWGLDLLVNRECCFLTCSLFTTAVPYNTPSTDGSAPILLFIPSLGNKTLTYWNPFALGSNTQAIPRRSHDSMFWVSQTGFKGKDSLIWWDINWTPCTMCTEQQVLLNSCQQHPYNEAWWWQHHVVGLLLLQSAARKIVNLSALRYTKTSHKANSHDNAGGSPWQDFDCTGQQWRYFKVKVQNHPNWCGIRGSAGIIT